MTLKKLMGGKMRIDHIDLTSVGQTGFEPATPTSRT